MTPTLTRKEFLKLAGLLPLTYAAASLAKNLAPARPNVLIVVFDAWSAYHLPVYGYPRQTTPFLDQMLDKAIVFHQNYAGANSTTPGTASLLSGTYPWTHRAFNHDSPAKEVERQNLFNAFGPEYHRLMYSHNAVADRVLKAFQADTEQYIRRQELFLTRDWVDSVFSYDYDLASTALQTIFKLGQSNSLFLPEAYRQVIDASREAKRQELSEEFPNQPPSIQENNYYLLEDGINWLLGSLPALPQPFLGYFHFLPPHAPYETNRQEFINTLRNQPFSQALKPEHLFTQGLSRNHIDHQRRQYDEYILYVDAEFSRLYAFMQQEGLLDNTWLVLTSDHGELFERGIVGHTTPAFFDPLVRVPLVMWGPGVTTRQDIHTPTSALDLLPTLTQLCGLPAPTWSEGEVLPPFKAEPIDPGRAIYAVNAKDNAKYQPLTHASISMRQGAFRLSAYFGSPQLQGETRYELYNLENDPEERFDLYTTWTKLAARMVDELNARLELANQPFL